MHSILQVVNHPSLNHQMKIRAGVLAGVPPRCCRNFFESAVSHVGERRASQPVERRWELEEFIFVRCGEVRERLKRSASKADIP